jgi:single-strand DNA-binding protein
MNNVILVGNLGADVEVRKAPGGQSVATLRVATNETYKDKTGQKQTRTEWHRVIVWGVQAENCAKYLTKGSSVSIEGRLTTRKWDDKNGQTRFTTEIVASRVNFLSSKKTEEKVMPAGKNEQQEPVIEKRPL